MNSSSRALFLGGHPALDFLNTVYGPADTRTETIGDGRALLDWMVGAGLLENEMAASKVAKRLGHKSLDSVAAEARKVREWARRWLERWRTAPQRNYDDEIATLNKLMAGAAWGREVSATNQALKIVERPHFDDPDALLALIAAQIADLVVRERPALMKQCAGAQCTLWFLDRTKAHRRAFCSAAACGNRAKVAAFRERQRGA